MQDSFRRNFLTLPLPAALAVSVGQVTYTAPRPFTISWLQLCLSDTGTGAGNTTVNLKQNGTTIGTVSIAGASGSKSAGVALISSAGSQFPPGVRINKGDVLTIDLAALPATTSPKAAIVALDIYELDV